MNKKTRQLFTTQKRTTSRKYLYKYSAKVSGLGDYFNLNDLQPENKNVMNRNRFFVNTSGFFPIVLIIEKITGRIKTYFPDTHTRRNSLTGTTPRVEEQSRIAGRTMNRQKKRANIFFYTHIYNILKHFFISKSFYPIVKTINSIVSNVLLSWFSLISL